jgi:hypothetical protein
VPMTITATFGLTTLTLSNERSDSFTVQKAGQLWRHPLPPRPIISKHGLWSRDSAPAITPTRSHCDWVDPPSVRYAKPTRRDDLDDFVFLDRTELWTHPTETAEVSNGLWESKARRRAQLTDSMLPILPFTRGGFMDELPIIFDPTRASVYSEVHESISMLISEGFPILL